MIEPDKHKDRHQIDLSGKKPEGVDLIRRLAERTEVSEQASMTIWTRAHILYRDGRIGGITSFLYKCSLNLAWSFVQIEGG